MARRISVEVRRELVRAIGERYRSGSMDAKARILDEFVAVTGYHRKHSIRVLNSATAATVTHARLVYGCTTRPFARGSSYSGRQLIASAASDSRRCSGCSSQLSNDMAT